MPKLPTISGDKAVKCFEKLGYEITRQKGSHVRMHHRFDRAKKPLTVPRHKELGKGLIRKLIRDAEINMDALIDLL